VRPALPVAPEQLAKAEPDIEARLRFAKPCVGAACHNFVGGACQLAGRFAADASERLAHPGPLPACAIRRRCEWFATEGSRACLICPSARNPGAAAERGVSA
jgi:hypothetical protein